MDEGGAEPVTIWAWELTAGSIRPLIRPVTNMAIGIGQRARLGDGGAEPVARAGGRLDEPGSAYAGLAPSSTTPLPS